MERENDLNRDSLEGLMEGDSYYTNVIQDRSPDLDNEEGFVDVVTVNGEKIFGRAFDAIVQSKEKFVKDKQLARSTHAENS